MVLYFTALLVAYVTSLTDVGDYSHLDVPHLSLGIAKRLFGFANKQQQSENVELYELAHGKNKSFDVVKINIGDFLLSITLNMTTDALGNITTSNFSESIVSAISTVGVKGSNLDKRIETIGYITDNRNGSKIPGPSPTPAASTTAENTTTSNETTTTAAPAETVTTTAAPPAFLSENTRHRIRRSRFSRHRHHQRLLSGSGDGDDDQQNDDDNESAKRDPTSVSVLVTILEDDKYLTRLELYTRLANAAGDHNSTFYKTLEPFIQNGSSIQVTHIEKPSEDLAQSLTGVFYTDSFSSSLSILSLVVWVLAVGFLL